MTPAYPTAPTPTAPELLQLADVQRSAALLLPQDIWDFVEGGAGDESAMQANRLCLDQVRVIPRILTGIASPDPSGELLGTAVSMPVAVAPMAYQRLVHPEGETAVARAAHRVGTVFIAGLLNSCRLEEIAETGACLWFQLYWLRDRGRLRQLIRRAEQVGVRALVLTVDMPRMGRRLRDMRNGFTLPSTVVAANLTATSNTAGHRRGTGRSAVMTHTADIFDPSLCWGDLAWIREQSQLPLVLKGILHPDDARTAAALGVDALIVSNHGGRQLDSAIGSLGALPGVVSAVDGRCPVYFDSGVRSGTDVVRALALGASGALIGRPMLWGLAQDGERGARCVLELVRDELVQAMALAGCADLAAIASASVAASQ